MALDFYARLTVSCGQGEHPFAYTHPVGDLQNSSTGTLLRRLDWPFIMPCGVWAFSGSRYPHTRCTCHSPLGCCNCLARQEDETGHVQIFNPSELENIGITYRRIDSFNCIDHPWRRRVILRVILRRSSVCYLDCIVTSTPSQLKLFMSTSLRSGTPLRHSAPALRSGTPLRHSHSAPQLQIISEPPLATVVIGTS